MPVFHSSCLSRAARFCLAAGVFPVPFLVPYCCFPSRKRQKKGGVKNVLGSPSIYLYLPGRLCAAGGRVLKEPFFSCCSPPVRATWLSFVPAARSPPPVCVLLLFPGLSIPLSGHDARTSEERHGIDACSSHQPPSSAVTFCCAVLRPAFQRLS